MTLHLKENLEIKDKEYMAQIKEIDNSIGTMLILYSLLTGFIITVLIEVYLNQVFPGFTITLLLFFEGIVNLFGIFWGIYIITIPNNVKFLLKFYKIDIGEGLGVKLGLTINKHEKNKTQAKLFEEISEVYMRFRKIFWINILITVTLFTILFISISLQFRFI
ncbi:MAG: hypothetical protein EAX96_20725 [Candidatus Lokiarchaeota archaeon]|nr:hypothetical protein [Candidatus Lokiarchaeota archaeon]